MREFLSSWPKLEDFKCSKIISTTRTDLLMGGSTTFGLVEGKARSVVDVLMDYVKGELRVLSKLVPTNEVTLLCYYKHKVGDWTVQM
ncbi:unnamed protein product [Arabis nemorensis]|uniref:Uncharacterized protein n=1 Tax=Arabis nemorensis TaxID=586526 RepID=A0A565C544_9BRAS|nr:unnamed protein product [Arabis nemorensis]